VSDIKTSIYEEYKNLIFNYFYKTTLNSALSEDLTQDTFLKAFRFFSDFRGESSIKTWLFKIARNTYLDHVSKDSRMSSYDFSEDVADDTDHYKSLDETILVRKILKILSDEERSLIILRDISGFSYSEISKIMELTEGQVKIGLYRARKKFRELYDKENREGL
jgi:RNA polymerase sigma-70 factor (ECF subfamily)